MCSYYRGRDCMNFGFFEPSELPVIQRGPYRGIYKGRFDSTFYDYYSSLTVDVILQHLILVTLKLPSCTLLFKPE